MDQVEEVKSKTDIVSLISDYVELKKAGRNFKGLCPFHGEKTPSFMVSPELQIFKCFGCGESGDAISFLQKHEGMEFPEALKFLAEKSGVKLAPTSFKGKKEKERIFEINKEASRFYQYILWKTQLGRRPLQYLLKDRGLKKETILEFKLGFSPRDSRELVGYLSKKKKFSSGDIVNSGLAYSSTSGLKDRFAGRVIFPLNDHRGNSIGFAGRLLPEDKRDQGKYINTPETGVYRKGSVLYGLDKNRSDIKKQKEVVVVEGELDLISSFQVGIKNVVAVKGTALTVEQIRLLSRFCEKMTLAMDSDFAGSEAAIRGITLAQNQGFEVKVATMGKYKDPDDAARKDPEFFKKSLKKSKDVWEFVIDTVVGKYNYQTGAGKAAISKEAIPYISSIDDKIVQSHYTKYLADKISVPLEFVAEQVSKFGVEKEAPALQAAEILSQKKTKRELLEEEFLALFFQLDENKEYLKDLSLIETPVYRKIVEVFKERGKENVKDFAKDLPQELREGFSTLFLKGSDDEFDDFRVLKKNVDITLKELRGLAVKEERKILAKRIKTLENEGKSKEALEISKKFSELGDRLSTLEEEDNKGIIL